MNNEMFNELLASTKQADEIINGNRKPSREFQFDKPQVKDIHKKQTLRAQLRQEAPLRN